MKPSKLVKSRKKYKVIPTKKQINIIKLYWKMFVATESAFYGQIGELERGMSKKTGIENLEFYHDEMCSGWVGIGQYGRDMKLIFREELEK